MYHKFKITPCYAPKGDGRLKGDNFDEFQHAEITKILRTYIEQFKAPIPVGLQIEPRINRDGDYENYVVWQVIYGESNGLPVMFVWLTEDEN